MIFPRASDVRILRPEELRAVENAFYGLVQLVPGLFSREIFLAMIFDSSPGVRLAKISEKPSQSDATDNIDTAGIIKLVLWSKIARSAPPRLHSFVPLRV